MNIISCHGFVNDTKSAVILSYFRKLVYHYLSKGFVIIENNPRAFTNVTLRTKQIINA